MKIKENIPDWKIAFDMFGKNSKKECNLIKRIRKHYLIEELTEDYSIIYDTSLDDDCGWIISNEFLEKTI